jgi:hypothetical protein
MLKAMKLSQADQEHLVQLATRIPQRIIRDLKAYCVRNEMPMQLFVRSALLEKLSRTKGSPASRRRV